MKLKRITYLHDFLTALILGLAISIHQAAPLRQGRPVAESQLLFLDIFGLGILLLSALGLLGDLLTAVQQNRVRFGVHMAAGAGTGHIFRLVLRDTVLKRAALPVILGSLCSQLLLSSGLLSSIDAILFPKAWNSFHLLLCAAGALAFLLLCALYHAAVAARVQPAEVLKGE